ncbi:phosphoserine phosphatase RsbU [bacterium BMS3Abin03]|nr:phosphoserine phosphatase RsbU [bacterium BMS3Abin03]
MILREYSKIFLFLSVLIFGTFKSFAVQIDPVHLYADTLEVHSTSLFFPWKYQQGDNPEWASPGFNDSGWDTMRTEINTDDQSYNRWQGIGWFRRVIVIDTALMNKPVALSVKHYGASEIYLNGKLVHKFGIVGTSLDDEEIYQRRYIPVTMTFGTDTQYVLAVRYSNFNVINNRDWFKNWFGYAGFLVRISKINNAILSSVLNEGTTMSINIGISGIFLSLSILYFILFLFYSMKKENLYYSFFTFLIAASFLAGMFGRFNQSNLELFALLRQISFVAIIWAFSAYLAFIYSIFYKKFPKQFWFFIIVAAAITIFGLLIYLPERIINYLVYGFMLLTTVEGLRAILIAIKRKKENARIIGIGVIVFFVFVTTLFVIGLLGMGNINSLIGVILFFIGLISLPLSMSVYLARDIASTNKNLELQLVTVKDLLEKELEHQKRAAELELETEKEKAAKKEAQLRAQIAEAENERKTKELEEARQLQLSMLPKELPQLPFLDIAVYMKTATEVGGDYYDFHLGLDGTLTIVIGDATGHGLKAGTMVTATKSLFNSYASNPDIIKTFHEITRVIKGMQLPSMSMCLSLLKINGNKLTMSAAGMPHALLYRSENKKVEEIILKGMPLGAVNDFPYQLKETELNEGDTLLLLSDGLPELFNSNMEMFGYSRVTEEFGKMAENSPDNIIKSLKNIALEWTGGGEPQDDITFVVLKVIDE